MTACDFTVVWSGGELLPPRAERTCLPIDRDYLTDRDALWVPDPDGRRCACGCGGILPKRPRRFGQRVRFLHGHHRRGLPSPLKGRSRC